MVASVIYGMVNFWSVVFVLPKAFYAKIDFLCDVFLRNNITSSAAGSRVAWKDLCRPKSEKGVGIRHLEDFQLIFGLKWIWNFFSKPNYILAAWLKKNVFGRNGFWLTQDSPRFSPTVRSTLQLKPMLNDFMHCFVNNGATAFFWFDTWILLGPLFSTLGENGLHMLRIRKGTTVMEAARESSWLFPPARSPTARIVQIIFTTVPPPSPGKGADLYLWRKADGSFDPQFSSKIIWEHIRQHSSPVY